MSAVGPAVPQQPNNGGLNQTVVACFAFSFGVHCVFFFFFLYLRFIRKYPLSGLDCAERDVFIL